MNNWKLFGSNDLMRSQIPPPVLFVGFCLVSRDELKWYDWWKSMRIKVLRNKRIIFQPSIFSQPGDWGMFFQNRHPSSDKQKNGGLQKMMQKHTHTHFR